MVELSLKEKKYYCQEFGKHVVKIRSLLKLSQGEFALRTGITRDKISRIENGKNIMSWQQLMSILFLCCVNLKTKEYFFANKLFTPKILQYLQQKDENIPPEVNIHAREELIENFAPQVLYNGD